MIDVLLLLAPAFALLCALLAGAYPGERAIVTLAARRRPARRRYRHRLAVSVLQRPPAARLPRGGRLVAAAIAARPPPDGCRRVTTSIHSLRRSHP